MKELFVIRHAKSDWGTPSLKDIDRPLNERGYSDAYFMSQWFLKNKKLPEKILSSTATRALNTALIFARTFEFKMPGFSLEKKIYECSFDTFLEVIRSQPGEVNSIAVFCHNPTITEFCNRMIKDFFIDNVPTCGVIGIKFSVNGWREIAPKKGDLDFYQFPKNFKNAD